MENLLCKVATLKPQACAWGGGAPYGRTPRRSGSCGRGVVPVGADRGCIRHRVEDLAREEGGDLLAGQFVVDTGIEDLVHDDVGALALDGHQEGVGVDVTEVVDEPELLRAALREDEHDRAHVADVPVEHAGVRHVEDRFQIVVPVERGAGIAGRKFGVVQTHRVGGLDGQAVGPDPKQKRRVRVREEQDLALRVGRAGEGGVDQGRHCHKAERRDAGARDTQDKFLRVHF